MINTMTTTTVPTTSTFGMPALGHAFGPATCARPLATVGTAVPASAIVRERGIGAVAAEAKGDMGLAQSYFPGTSAWRPPSC